jgi:phosphoadenosine phosphosulfate reductase
MSQETIELLNKKYGNAPAEQLIEGFLSEFKGKIALSSSLGLEDQVLTHMVCSIDKSTQVFTLDTGRLFPETYDQIHAMNQDFP